MTLKLWEVNKGRIIFLMHTNSKNESRLVKLREHIEYDNVKILSDLDNAIELMTTFVVSIKKFDNIEKNETVEGAQLNNADENKTDKVEKEKSEEAWAWGNDLVGDETKKDVPEEVKSKLGALLETDIGNTRGAQYLMHKNARVGANKGKDHLPASAQDNPTNGDTAQKDGAIKRREGKDIKSGKDAKNRSKYEGVVSEILPEILDGIENSVDKTITMKVSDILARMDEGISVSKSPGNIYTGLKLRLFANNIVADQISVGDADAITHKKEKALVMRMRNDTDTLPGYILRNRSRRLRQ